ncbi:hypothetical protein DL95DRAFT_50228 [Leptodontidium sp. 2 PMI_412]|nr:hypothetical protein DL95DRAFT_50228 [Leptodontidium sp. 2 PMI_412]
MYGWMPIGNGQPRRRLEATTELRTTTTRTSLERGRLPYLTLPYLTLPYLTLPYLTLPYLTLPYLTCPPVCLPGCGTERVLAGRNSKRGEDDKKKEKESDKVNQTISSTRSPKPPLIEKSTLPYQATKLTTQRAKPTLYHQSKCNSINPSILQSRNRQALPSRYGGVIYDRGAWSSVVKLQHRVEHTARISYEISN